jgi:hypothetical protein
MAIRHPGREVVHAEANGKNIGVSVESRVDALSKPAGTGNTVGARYLNVK